MFGAVYGVEVGLVEMKSCFGAVMVLWSGGEVWLVEKRGWCGHLVVW